MLDLFNPSPYFQTSDVINALRFFLEEASQAVDVSKRSGAIIREVNDALHCPTFACNNL